MIDKQIKQNAKLIYGQASNSEDKINAYIAGAHSRDDEINQLRKALSSAQTAMAELAQMASNPWISVKDKLPPRDEKTVFPTDSIEVYAICDNYPLKVYTRVRYSYPFKLWTIGFENPDNPKEKLNVTHWMPIPELKKGE